MRVSRHESDLLFPANLALLAEANELGARLDPAAAPEGRLDPREEACLYVLARRAGPLGNVVEIGSLTGRSTWFLARGLEDSGSAHRVVAIDPHLEGSREAFHANIERTGVAARVEPRVAFSHDVSEAGFDEPVGLVWIDGDHSYEGVRTDFVDWFPRLAVGGWVAFHDTVGAFPGTTRLVREVLARPDVARVGLVGTIVFAQKVPAGRAGRLRALPGRLAFALLAALWTRRWQRAARN